VQPVIEAKRQIPKIYGSVHRGIKRSSSRARENSVATIGSASCSAACQPARAFHAQRSVSVNVSEMVKGCTSHDRTILRRSDPEERTILEERPEERPRKQNDPQTLSLAGWKHAQRRRSGTLTIEEVEHSPA